MKASPIVLLPLAASAAVIGSPDARPEAPIERRQTGSGSRGDDLVQYLFKTYGGMSSSNSLALSALLKAAGFMGGKLGQVNGAIQSIENAQDKLEAQLPQAFQQAVPLLATALQWASSPVYTEDVPAVLEPVKAKKKLLRYGPFVLRGTSEPKREPLPIVMDPASDMVIRQLKGLPQNAAILSGRMDTVFEDGSKADVSKGVYIHHLLVADVGKNTAAPFAACPGGRRAETLFNWVSYHTVNAIGAGLIQSGNDQVGDANTYYSNHNGVKSAFLTGIDDIYLLEAEIINYNKQNTTVYLQMEIEYLPDKLPGMMDASTVIFSATGCARPGYRPPAGTKQYNYTSQPFVMDYDGVIVNNRGHLHDGGVAMHMLLNDKLVCESLPTYGAPPDSKPKPGEKEWKTILGMSPCPNPVPFRRGDAFKLISIYDTDKHPLRAGTGHGHGGKEGADAKGDKQGGHEGGDEMGIFTANIAVDPKSPRRQPPRNINPQSNKPAVGAPASQSAPGSGPSFLQSLGDGGSSGSKDEKKPAAPSSQSPSAPLAPAAADSAAPAKPSSPLPEPDPDAPAEPAAPAAKAAQAMPAGHDHGGAAPPAAVAAVAPAAASDIWGSLISAWFQGQGGKAEEARAGI